MMLCVEPLCINITDECINLFIAQIMLDTEQSERAAWFDKRGLRLFQTRGIVHSDKRCHCLTASLNNDMLSLIRNFSDQRGEMRLCRCGAHTSVCHHFNPYEGNDQKGQDVPFYHEDGIAYCRIRFSRRETES